MLIEGESGTGKELFARTLHALSLRADQPFVAINCAAIPETLLESELFGHEKGAFTGADKQRVGRFEQADGGTLFLDEVGDMSANTQAKILRVLQEHEFERLGGTRTLRVDVRVIAATNRNLPQMVANGLFREDLYYRLNVVSIDMPPLRERKDDIQQLAMFFLRRFSGELKKKIVGLETDALKLLMRYQWPGNIRELENAIERAMLLAEGSHIAVDDLRLGDFGTSGSPREGASVVKIPPTGIPLEEVERIALIEALGLERPSVAGFSEGGMTATLVALRRPDLVSGLVNHAGFDYFDPHAPAHQSLGPIFGGGPGAKSADPDAAERVFQSMGPPMSTTFGKSGSATQGPCRSETAMERIWPEKPSGNDVSAPMMLNVPGEPSDSDSLRLVPSPSRMATA